MGLNRWGQVVGDSVTAGGATHAFSWTRSGGMVDLGTLGGTWGRATRVSDNGRVIGSSKTAAGHEHAFTWTESDGMVDLGTVGSTYS